MTKFYAAVYSFERVRGYQFVKLYISMFEKWLESPQWLLAVSKPEVRMRVMSAWGQELLYSRGHFTIIKWWWFLEMGSSGGENRRSRACYATLRDYLGTEANSGDEVACRRIASRIVWTVLLISLEPIMRPSRVAYSVNAA